MFKNMAGNTVSNESFKRACGEIADALADALEACENLKDEFSGAAASAFFESVAAFDTRTASPLIKAALSLAGRDR